MLNFPAPVMDPSQSNPFMPQAPIQNTLSPNIIAFLSHFLNSPMKQGLVAGNQQPQVPQVMPAPIPVPQAPMVPTLPTQAAPQAGQALAQNFAGMNGWGSGMGPAAPLAPRMGWDGMNGGMPGGMDAGMGPRNLRRY